MILPNSIPKLADRASGPRGGSPLCGHRQQFFERSAGPCGAAHEAPPDRPGVRQHDIPFRKDHFETLKTGQAPLPFFDPAKADSCGRASTFHP